MSNLINMLAVMENNKDVYNFGWLCMLASSVSMPAAYISRILCQIFLYVLSISQYMEKANQLFIYLVCRVSWGIIILRARHTRMSSVRKVYVKLLCLLCLSRRNLSHGPNRAPETEHG